MRSTLLALLLATAACAPAARGGADPPAPAAMLSIRQIPRSVGAFSQTEVHRYADPGLGVLYRYRGTSLLQPDVYVYPLGEEARTGGPLPMRRAAAESRLFPMVLDYDRQRGRHDSFTIVADSGVVFRVGGQPVEGWHIHAHVTRRGETRESHQHLFAIGERMVKVRSSFAPGSTAARDLEPFLAELLRTLLTPASGAAPAPP